MIQFALYRPFRVAVAAALLLSMAMPPVTYACDLSGLIGTSMVMADHTDDAKGSESDCPCEGPMQDMCAPRADDCASIVRCHSHAFHSDACCSLQPELKDAVVSPSKHFDQLQASLAGVIVGRQVQVRHVSPNEASGPERAPPLETPMHILHSSLLL